MRSIMIWWRQTKINLCPLRTIPATRATTNIFKNQSELLATKPNYDNTEIINYTTGRQFRNVDLLSGFDGTNGFRMTTSFSDKLWNFDISEYDGSSLLFIYTKAVNYTHP